MNVLTIHNEIGADKRIRRVINTETDHLQKQFIRTMSYDNERHCCVKAIALFLAHLENNRRDIETLQKRICPDPSIYFTTNYQTEMKLVPIIMD